MSREYIPSNDEIIEMQAHAGIHRAIYCACGKEIPSALLDKNHLCFDCNKARNSQSPRAYSKKGGV